MGLSKMSLRTFFRNFYHLFVSDFHKLDVERRLQWTELKDLALPELMRRYFDENNSMLYKDEIDYVYRNGVRVFPYEQLGSMGQVESGVEPHSQMPYVIHQGKRLYFPKDKPLEQAEWYYRQLIETENLLGGNYTSKMPHCYQSERMKVEEGDVFVDVGAAEGLVALDVIDKVSKVYVIESDPQWMKALRATFEPYKEKCVIVPKLVTDHDGLRTVTLESLLKNETEHPVFVKMDIEGYEKKVLETAKGFLARRNNIKLACCTYHCEGDADVLSGLLGQLGYSYEFSDGWMLFSNYDKTLPNPPFFRHGMIRAWK